MGPTELGKITNTFLGYEDHGIFTFTIYLEFGGSGQAFGNYGLSEKNEAGRVISPIAGEVITGILGAVGVSNWEDLIGKVVFVERENGIIRSIEAPSFVPHKGKYDIKDHFEEYKNR